MIGEEAVQACGLLDLHTCHAVRNALQSFYLHSYYQCMQQSRQIQSLYRDQSMSPHTSPILSAGDTPEHSQSICGSGQDTPF